MPLDMKAIAKAVEEAKKASKETKFTQSLDLIVTLKDIDPKKPENRFVESVELPNQANKTVRVCVIASGDLALRARNAKADLVVDRDELEKLGRDKKAAKKIASSYDFFIAEAPLMPLVGKTVGGQLGPRGKMPTPVPPNAPIDSVIGRHRRLARIRLRDQLSVQCRVGTVDMSSEKIAENVQAVISRLEGRLEKGVRNFRRVALKTTMGAPSKVELV